MDVIQKHLTENIGKKCYIVQGCSNNGSFSWYDVEGILEAVPYTDNKGVFYMIKDEGGKAMFDAQSVHTIFVSEDDSKCLTISMKVAYYRKENNNA